MTALLLVSALTACASFSGTNTSFPPLRGMIYDRENKPVPEVQIAVGDKTAAYTDINGHFTVLSAKKNQEIAITFSKPGFETVSFNFTYSDATQILYVTLYSADQLIHEAEIALEAGKWNETENYLARAEQTSGNKTVIGYVRALSLIRQKRYTDAESILDTLISESPNEPYVQLLAADFYQYSVGDSEKAKTHLSIYLSLRWDSAADERLRALAQ